ncbi:hypothetical protein [Thorsellia kenyensis]|uniref:Secreted protein n=1 Tax=Thorsellia kenyensis TaxID=1549888 RepID=A0ABV6CAJ9_9GAMM
MKKFVFPLLLLLPFYSYSSTCQENDVLVFSCDLPKNKSAAICANQTTQTLNYSFVNNEKIELSKDFDSNHQLIRWLDKGNYTTYLGFKGGEYFYRFILPQETFGAYASIEIHRKAHLIATLDCTENSFGEKNIVSKAIQEIPDELGDSETCYLGLFCQGEN